MSHATLTREIEDWLIAEALCDPEILGLFERLCIRLGALGIPLDRAVLSWPTLHPLFRSELVSWRPGDEAKLEQFYHSATGNEQYQRSPFFHAQKHGLKHLRRRLESGAAMTDFLILEELSAEGFTDYLLTSTTFRIAEVGAFGNGPTGLMASWSTRRKGGFSDDDLDALQRIQQVMAVACRSAVQRRVMTNIARAYLGPTAGDRVLAGDIRRGDGDRIPAVVWFSDLRGSTRLSDTMDPDSYLSLLNRYFECTAQPVIDRGGEVLNFIGDGVLAIFPIDESCARDAAARAEAAAIEALKLRAETPGPDGEPLFRFGIGLAVGEVMFGNIGVPGRLAFSAIGRVVNEVNRVETATVRLGRPVLATADFVRLAPGDWQPAGRLEIADFRQGFDVFALAEGGAADRAAE